MESALAEVFAAESESQHGDDLQDGGRDGQHVCCECSEAETLDSQCQISLNRRRGNIGDEANEVETPH